MNNPYAERLVKAFQLLKDRGIVSSQNKFSEAVGIPSNHFPAVKRGRRGVTPENITNLCLKFGVSSTYIVLGIEPIMAPKPRQLKPEGQTELERQLVAERARRETLEKLMDKLLAAKDAEIAYYRELLRLEVNRLREGS